MRKNYIVKIIAVLLLFTSALSSCDSECDGSAVHEHQQQYSCPMHPDVKSDKPGQCPVCGMDLVAAKAADTGNLHDSDSSIIRQAASVNQKIVSGVSVITPESGTRIISVKLNGVVTYDSRKQTSVASRVAGRIERLLIKYNFQQVKKGQLIMEIYSPDLAAAQRELLFIKNAGNEEQMLARAKQRLQLSGMQMAQINQVLTTGNILYRVPVYSPVTGYILQRSNNASAAPTVSAPASAAGADGMGGRRVAMATGVEMGAGGSAPTSATSGPVTSAQTPLLLREGQYVSAGQSLFTIYDEGNLIAEFAIPPSLVSEINKGDRILFQPGGDRANMQSGKIGLIEPVLRGGSSFSAARIYLGNSALKPGELLVGHLPIVFDKGYWVPAKAVARLGRTAVVFRQENGSFEPVEVSVGADLGDRVQILNDAGDWTIASNASYLVDSESFIKLKTQHDAQ